MGRPLGSKNKPKDGTEKLWKIGALIRDKDLEYAIKYRALDDDISYEELVIAGIKLYLQTPPKHPDRYLNVSQKVFKQKDGLGDIPAENHKAR
ncbi:MAG: hypothetical protein ACYDHF_05850 [Candidatus Cryosericum sp.]